MIRKLALFTPSFLKKIDKKLLIQNPVVWATRVHYVLFFGLLWLGLLMVKAFSTPIELGDMPNWWGHGLLVIIPTILGFCVWVYQLTLFKVERHFGETEKRKSLLTQWIYLGCIALILAGPLVYGKIMQDRVQDKIAEANLFEAVNALNLGDVYFPVDGLEVRNLPDDYYSFDVFRYGGGMSRHYYKYNSIEIDGVGILQEEALVNRHRSLTDPERLEVVRDFMRTFERFSDYRFTVSAEDVMAQYESSPSLFINDRTFRDERVQVRKSLADLWGTQERLAWFAVSPKDAANTLFMGGFLVFLVWISLMLFLRVGWKVFLAAVGTGVVSAIVLGSLGSYLVYLTNSPVLIQLLYIGFGFGLLIMGFYSPGTRHNYFWLTVLLTLGVSMLPLAPMVFFAQSIHTVTSVQVLLGLGMLITYVGWVWGLDRRLTELQAFPRQS